MAGVHGLPGVFPELSPFDVKYSQAVVFHQSLSDYLSVAVAPFGLCTHKGGCTIRPHWSCCQFRKSRLAFRLLQQICDASNLVAQFWAVPVGDSTSSTCLLESTLFEMRKAAAARYASNIMEVFHAMTL